MSRHDRVIHRSGGKERLVRMLEEGIASPDDEAFHIKRVIARLLRQGEQSGQPVPWQPGKIKALARRKVWLSNRR